MIARRTQIGIIYEGTDISRDLAPHLRALTFSDALSAQSDDVQIELEDRDALWAAWQPTEGDTHEAWIEAESAIAGGEIRRLECGRVRVDDIDYSGPPSVVKISALSAYLSVGLARTRRTRAWAESSLHAIAQDIAERAGLDLSFAAPDPGFRRRRPPRPAPPPEPDATSAQQAALADRYGADILARAARAPVRRGGPRYERVDQRDETDLAFLLRLCEEYGLNLKITDGTIAIFLEADLEAAPPLALIRLGHEGIISYSLHSSASDKYASCTVTYRDPATGRMRTGHAPRLRRDQTPAEPNLAITHRVESDADAEQLAADLLRGRNKNANSGALVMVGDPSLYSGATLEIECRGLSGRYLVQRVVHAPTGGYTMTLDVRRVLDPDGRPA